MTTGREHTPAKGDLLSRPIPFGDSLYLLTGGSPQPRKRPERPYGTSQRGPRALTHPMRLSQKSRNSRGNKKYAHPDTLYPGERINGADDGNRTRVICLEGRGSTIELHPRTPEGDTKILAGIVHVRDIYTRLPYDGAPDTSPTGCSAAW